MGFQSKGYLLNAPTHQQRQIEPTLVIYLLLLALVLGLPLQFAAAKDTQTFDCHQHSPLQSGDRQNIADLRYELSTIDHQQTDFEFNGMVSLIINTRAHLFKTQQMLNYLQGLIAEAQLRRELRLNLNPEYPTYRQFEVLVDLIIYHRAMDHKGYVDLTVLTDSKRRLINHIDTYFGRQQEHLINKNNLLLNTLPLELKDLHAQKSMPTQEIVQQFSDLRSKQTRILGLLEITWVHLVHRNEWNKLEVMSNQAIVESSIHAAVAISGFAGLIGFGVPLLATIKASWALPLTVIAGCGFGVGNRYLSQEVNMSYLELSRAVYRSVLHDTTVTCELGKLKHLTPTSSDYPNIPDESKPPGVTDYLMSCAAVGSSILFPKVATAAVSGFLMASFTASSYYLIKESIMIANELPRYYQMKQALQQTAQSTPEFLELEKKIRTSKARIALYMLALGNQSIDAFRSGLLIYGDKKNVNTTIEKVKNFFITYSGAEESDVLIMNLILKGLKS